MSHTLTIRLDAKLNLRLLEAARGAKQPVSALVREAVTEWLERSGSKRAVTLLSAAGALKGSGRSATNENVRAAFRRRAR
jgi:predicted transcriptional regulator